MRPLRLEMEGFGSFREPTVVELDDADLFVLSGPTGAGKSTVIDAVVFALYGKVPRLADDRAVEPVISRGLVEARVRCTFRCRGEVYAATRVVRRTRGGGASTKEARLETADGRVLAGNVRELDSRVEDLLGLAFEHFTRCVVLPQGAFQAFLHAKGSDRQKLLSSLLHLGIYAELRRRAGEDATAAKARMDAAEAQLQGRLANASTDAVEQAERRATALAGLRARLEDAQPAYEDLLAAGRAAAERQRAATERHAALVALERPADVDDTSAELAALDERLNAATTAREVATAALDAARTAVESHPSADAVATQADRVRRLAGARSQVEQATKALTSAEAAVAQRRGAVEAAEHAARSATTAVETVRDRARAATLAAGLAAGDDCPVCLRELDEAPAHLHAAPGRTASPPSGAAPTRRPDADDGRAAHGRDPIGGGRAGPAEAVGAEAVGAEAVDGGVGSGGGDPSAAVRAAQAAARRADEELRTARSALGTAERADATARATVASARAQVTSLTDEVAASELPDDLDRLGGLAARAAGLAEARAAAAADDEQAAKTLVTAKAAVAAAEERRRLAARRLAAARDGVASLGWARPRDARFEEATVADTSGSDHDAGTSGAGPGTHGAAPALHDDETAAAVGGASALVGAGVADEPGHTETLVGPPPIDPEANVAAGWDALLVWRDARLDDVAAEVAAAADAADAARGRYRALLAEHRAAARELGVTVDDGGGQPPLVAVAAAAATADADVVRCKEDLAERDRIRAEAKQARQEQQLLRTLAQRLDRKNFQQWLLNRALARVVAGATDILHDLSGGTYRLAVTDDGSFAVIDRANADERRSVRTLSGGETFLASLSLALALSDHVVEMAADGAAPLETLFIDEGFGTLDAETLQVVAAALHELSASGRAVGIVTHVAELARLVPTRFEVRKVGNASTISRVEVEL